MLFRRVLAHEGSVKSKGAWLGAQAPPISGLGALQTLFFIFQRSRVGVISICVDSFYGDCERDRKRLLVLRFFVFVGEPVFPVWWYFSWEDGSGNGLSCSRSSSRTQTGTFLRCRFMWISEFFWFEPID